MTEEEIIELGHTAARLLPSGEWAGTRNFFYTTGLIVGIDEAGYRTRFCYPTLTTALAALAAWDGSGDPPGPWLKEKGQNERRNPATFKGLTIIEEAAPIDPKAWERL
jgi:hypothetical protein